MSTGTILTIEDIPVEFPFPPYDCQVDYMRNTLQAIKTSSNAILESPTGTGKTLCLLCSTLAWQKSEAHKVAGANSTTASSSSSSSSTAPSASAIFKMVAGHESKSKGAGTIIYSSRTHSQLKQVVSELRATGYCPNMTILGSREQLCVHDKISRLKGNTLNHACNAQNAKRACSFKNNLDSYMSNTGSNGIINSMQDIEDLVRMGKKDRVCPYFFSKEKTESADLVLLPYNYLMDGSFRSTLNVDWNDSIVIFDEAHNLERVAADASSFSLSSVDIGACITELQNVLRRLQEDSVDSTVHTKEEKISVTAGMVHKPNLHVVMRILKALFEIERRIDDVPLSRQGAIKTNSCVHSGDWLVKLFDASGLCVSNASQDIDELRRCADYIVEESNSVASVSTSLTAPDPKISTFAKYLTRVFRGKTLQQCVKAADDYKVYIEEEDITKKTHSSSPGSSHMKPTKKRVVNYWCFSSSQAMQELKKMGVRSIIMTSGTLSPMNAFRDDLNIPISVELENPHVIKKSQIHVGALAVGPSGKQLNSSYNVRDTSDYKDELGASIFVICQTMGSTSTNSHLPPALNLEGGILVFFPSYGHMENSVSRWKETGMYDRLVRAGGGIVIEPRAGSAASTSKVDDSRKSWNDKYNFKKPTTSAESSDYSGGSAASSTTDDDSKLLTGLVGQLDSILAKEKRCIMLAVCRGKVSEGIDFKDSKARVVIITGIPFAPHMDPWVVLKKQYLDERKSQKQIIGSSVRNLSGQGWYMQSASRAINQAVGRVIRHKNDWGAIFLMDDRFLSEHQSSQLSGWVKSGIKRYPKAQRGETYNPFLTAMNHFHIFAKQAMDDPLLNPIPEPKKVMKRPVIPKFEERSDSDEDDFSSYRKTVIINADSIKDADSSSFVNPSLLVSQNTEEPKAPGSNNIASTAKIVPKKDTEADLLSVMSRLKKDTTKAVNVPSAVPKSLNVQLSQSVEHLPKENGYTSLQQAIKHSSLKAENPFAKAQSAASFSSSISRSNNSTKIGLTADCIATAFDIKQEVAPWNVRQEVPAQPESVKYHPFFGKHNANAKGSNKLDKGDAVDNLHGNERSTFNINRYLEEDQEKDDFTTMKSYILTLKSQLERSEFKSFKNVVTSASTSGLTEIRKVHEFIQNVVVALNSLGDSKLDSTLKILIPLIPLKFRDEYKSTCRKTLQSRKMKRKAVITTNSTPSTIASSSRNSSLKRKKTDSMPATSPRNESIEEFDDGNVESIIQSQSENNTSSRRALALLGMSQKSLEKGKDSSTGNNLLLQARNNTLYASKAQLKQTSRPYMQNDNGKGNKNTLSRIDSISSMELSENSSSNPSCKLMKCLICTEYTVGPYAANCGHICCFKCWQQWFKVKKECPVCRKNCCMDSIVKISISNQKLTA